MRRASAVSWGDLNGLARDLAQLKLTRLLGNCVFCPCHEPKAFCSDCEREGSGRCQRGCFPTNGDKVALPLLRQTAEGSGHSKASRFHTPQPKGWGGGQEQLAHHLGTW